MTISDLASFQKSFNLIGRKGAAEGRYSAVIGSLDKPFGLIIVFFHAVPPTVGNTVFLTEPVDHLARRQQ